VPAGPDNPAGYVNAATQTAATIVATFAGPTDPADQISLSVGGMALPTQSGGGDEISWTADLSSLPDGALPITGTIVDGNGVTSTFSGSLIKDTDPPPAPAVASVVGPPPNTITPSGASCVKVFVAFNQAPQPNDDVTVTLSDGSNVAQGSASAGDGHLVVGCIDASSLSAGQVTVNVTVTDAAGNSTDFTGTPAVRLACNHGGQGDEGGQSADE
jgi:large repetitive protein